MRDISARELKGHNILAVERFWDNTRWMIEFSVLRPSTAYGTVNMLIKCVFYSAERSQLITDNPCVGISAKGGKASKKKDALTDQQVAVLLDTVKELPPYLFIMIGLYSGLRREEILALQWDCVFLDESTP